MIKIEATTLEDAYADAATRLQCSVTQLQVEIVQHPSKGFLGMFKKGAIIVARCTVVEEPKAQEQKLKKADQKPKKEKVTAPVKQEIEEKPVEQTVYNDTIMPESFVTDQDEVHVEEQSLDELKESAAAYDSSEIDSSFFDEQCEASDVVQEISEKINKLFSHICFDIDAIKVCVYNEDTILVEFSGKDAALLIGKEGYRYKALSYMIFNWISSEYNLQLRLEIAEFLMNQEESISRYLVSVCETVERDGRAQTKVLDGVLVQIALKQLREIYSDKYVAIRSTRDGLKFIIINDYNNGY
ncbi:MAG: Jag N-terminal domain-containing protein [Campylobacterota bacterium]|nr:Jag N-terminal domain-containing protein [Campylobacterota bacterium]